MKTTSQFVQSLLSAASVAEYVEQTYRVGQVQECHLHMSGVNDVYQLLTEHEKFFFKVYRYGGRTPENVRFETDFLEHLRREGTNVALPTRDEQGKAVGVIPMPEGERAVVLYQAASGHSPKWPFYQDTHEAQLLGRTLAGIHTAGKAFSSFYERERIDTDTLFDAALAAISPFVESVPRGEERLTESVQKLREELGQRREQGLTETVCHGDFHCGNVFVSEETEVTTFDFDACGYGWAAFDLARWRSLANGTAGDASWDAFLEGYLTIAPLTQGDQDAIPLFVKLRHLHWARIKLTFVQRGQWARWDTGFFLSDLLDQIAV